MEVNGQLHAPAALPAGKQYILLHKFIFLVLFSYSSNIFLWEDDFGLDLKEMVRKGVDWMYLAQNRGQ
jgi:hypothetical protein